MFHYKPYHYVKGRDEALDQAFAGAEAFGKVRVAAEGLFWRSGLRRYYIPLEGIRRIHRRVEISEGRLCAGGRTYIIEWLVLILPEGEELVIPICDNDRKTAEALMEALKERHPEIPYGKV